MHSSPRSGHRQGLREVSYRHDKNKAIEYLERRVPHPPRCVPR
jgi:hypothetical protein